MKKRNCALRREPSNNTSQLTRAGCRNPSVTEPTEKHFPLTSPSIGQHAPRRAMNASAVQPDPSSATEQPHKNPCEVVCPIEETFELSLTEEDEGATGGRASAAITSEALRDGKESVVECPLTCKEAAAFVRVHPKTVKRMARSGELPGHFRFGRWFFYASELDCWMRTELHSSRHSCR